MEYHMVCGNIVKAKTECIVNSLGTFTDVYGNVCEAIIEASGSAELKNYIDSLGVAKVQTMYVTDAYNLPSKHIIHIVSPYKWEDDKELSQLKLAYENVILKASESGYASIAIPYLATGANGYSNSDVFAAATSVIRKYYDSPLKLKVYLVAYSGDEKHSVSNLRKEEERLRHTLHKTVPTPIDMLKINEVFAHYKEADAFIPKCEIEYPIEFALLAGENRDLSTKDIYSCSDYQYYDISRFKSGKKSLEKIDVYKLAVILKMNPTEFLQFMSYARFTFDYRSDIDWRFYSYVMKGSLPSNLQELADDLPSKYKTRIITKRL